MWYAILSLLLAVSVAINAILIKDRRHKAQTFRDMEKHLDEKNEKLEEKINAARKEFDELRDNAKADNLDDIASRLDRLGFTRRS